MGKNNKMKIIKLIQKEKLEKRIKRPNKKFKKIFYGQKYLSRKRNKIRSTTSYIN